MGRLILSRKSGESILIHPLEARKPILLTLGKSKEGSSKLEFLADSSVMIDRAELSNKIIESLGKQAKNPEKVERLITEITQLAAPEAEDLANELRYALANGDSKIH
jgi:sRNA-binding carbon storage regulator CsrA